MSDIEDEKRIKRGAFIVKVYPLGLLLMSMILNYFVFGVDALFVSLPSLDVVHILVIAGVILVFNHTWIMTVTELTRGRYGMCATQEEYAARGRQAQDVSEEGVEALGRCHNIHRNTTENTIYFVFLAIILSVVSPSVLAVQFWVLSFPLARLGYTYSYLKKRTGARGFFMSVSLLSLYGMASYLVIGL